MPLTNPNKVVTEERLSEFYGQILPYMGGMPDVLANKFSKGDLYSTSEKMIGCWTDGKPLYQISMQASVSDKTTIPIANISTLNILNWSGVFVQSSSNNTFKLNTTTDAWVYVERSFNGFYFQSTSNWTGEVYITLQYTKTTDSPIAIGSESDYDSTEKIVGTWFGEWLYQKTINFGTLPDNTLKTVSTGLTNVHVLCCSGQTYRPSDGSSFPIPYASTVSTEVIKCGTRNNGASIEIGTGMDRTAFTETYVTLLYTKTS